MKNTLIFSVLLCLNSAFSQTKTELKHLLKSYTKAEIESFNSSNPEKIEILTYALKNGLYFGDFNENKHGNLPILEGYGNEKNFTDYGLKIKDTNQYYYCPEINKVMVLKSFWVLKNEKSCK